MKLERRSYWIFGALFVLTATGVASGGLKAVTTLNPGSGLAGGGTGPTVTLGIAPGGVDASHLSESAKAAVSPKMDFYQKDFNFGLVQPGVFMSNGVSFTLSKPASVRITGYGASSTTSATNGYATYRLYLSQFVTTLETRVTFLSAPAGCMGQTTNYILKNLPAGSYSVLAEVVPSVPMTISGRVSVEVLGQGGAISAASPAGSAVASRAAGQVP